MNQPAPRTMTKEDALDAIELSEVESRDKIRRFLESYGWEMTCVNPGATWLWSKTIDGRNYYVSEDTAMYFERNLP